MKIIIDLKHVKTIEQLEQLLKRESFDSRLNEIINDKSAKGLNITNYKGNTVYKIRLKGFKKESSYE